MFLKLQEPQEAAEQDIEKLQNVLEVLRDRWEDGWSKTRDILEAQRQLCQFNYDLQQITDNLQETSKQLDNIKSQYVESLSAVKAKSQAFAYFEKTVEVYYIFGQDGLD